MLVTELGIVTETRFMQSTKSESSILVTELGIVIEVNPKQRLNASSPIDFTDSGIVIEVRASQFLKAQSPILVTELGIIVFLQPATSLFVAVSIRALQFSLLSKAVLPSSTEMEVRAEQPTKANSPILFTSL